MEPLYGSRCRCQGVPSLIVRSREGGFVTQNCVHTGRPRAIHLQELPDIQCAQCHALMEAFTSPETNNYAYRCPKCHRSVELPDIDPHWSERFEYFGYGLDSDFVTRTPITPSIDLQEILRRLRGDGNAKT